MTIKTLQVGPIMTNCYLLCDEAAKICALIDPGDWTRRTWPCAPSSAPLKSIMAPTCDGRSTS